jgi:hypothetical protein
MSTHSCNSNKKLINPSLLHNIGQDTLFPFQKENDFRNLERNTSIDLDKNSLRRRHFFMKCKGKTQFRRRTRHDTAVSGMGSQASNIHLGERNTEEVNNNLDNSID